MRWHRTQASILVDAGVEMLAFETFPAQKEAEAVVRLLRELPSTTAWISFSCKVCVMCCIGPLGFIKTILKNPTQQVFFLGGGVIEFIVRF